MTRYIKGRAHIEAELASRRPSLWQAQDSVLLEALRGQRPALTDALLLYWIPEQCEDIYEVLVDRETVAIVEIDRESQAVTSFELRPAAEYVRRLSPSHKRQFFVAQEMVARGVRP